MVKCEKIHDTFRSIHFHSYELLAWQFPQIDSTLRLNFDIVANNAKRGEK